MTATYTARVSKLSQMLRSPKKEESQKSAEHALHDDAAPREISDASSNIGSTTQRRIPKIGLQALIGMALQARVGKYVCFRQ